MTDPEFEELLQRYRPAGPSPDLRARVLSADTRRAWPWAAAAAVLLAATVYFHESVDRLIAGVHVNPSPNATQEAISMLTEMLGGDGSARLIAEAIISSEEIRIERDREAIGSAGTIETQ